MRYIRIIEVEGSSPLPLSWRLLTLVEFAVFTSELLDNLIDGKQYEMRLATEAEALEWQHRQRDWIRAEYT